MSPLTTTRPLSNAIPRIYTSPRRNAYVLEFEQFKRTITSIRTYFPSSPILEFQMSDWLSHRLSMLELSTSELQARIDAAEAKLRLQREGKWVGVKSGREIDKEGLDVVGWRERYGCFEWECRARTEDGEGESAPGLSDEVSLWTDGSEVSSGGEENSEEEVVFAWEAE